MDDINHRRLQRRFPVLYRDIGLEGTTMFYGLTVGDGWFDLIWKLSEDLEKLDPALVASQVKEKFGTLRFYLVTSGQTMDERVRDRISLAEKKSACTCEKCGASGQIYQGGGLYRHVACEPCEKGINDEYLFRHRVHRLCGRSSQNHAKKGVERIRNMNIYFDTEFTDFVIDQALISIGFVANDGREFYAELNDTYDEVMCSYFVLGTVLPALWGKEYEISIKDLAPKLKAWIESFGEEPVTLWADAPTHDWAWIQSIFSGSACGWPANLWGKCKNTQIFENDNERFRYNNAYADYWKTKKADGAVEHHALWDARCIRHAHRYGLRKRIAGNQ